MALVMLGIVPPLWGAIWYASYRAANLFQAEAQENMALRAEALAERVSQWHSQNSSVLDDLRTEADFSNMEREEQLPTMLSALQSAQGEVDAVVTVDTEGEVIAEVSAQPRSHENYRQQPWFQDALAGDEHSRVQLMVGREPTVIFSKPIVSLPTLSVGDRGEAVAQLQSRLYALNYYMGPIDGLYEGETVLAVQNFKWAYHRELSHGDQVDPLTWQAISFAEQSASGRTESAPPAQPGEADDVEGVIMMEAPLDDIKQAAKTAQAGKQGYALVLDETGQVLAHYAAPVSEEAVSEARRKATQAKKAIAVKDASPIVSSRVDGLVTQKVTAQKVSAQKVTAQKVSPSLSRQKVESEEAKTDYVAIQDYAAIQDYMPVQPEFGSPATAVLPNLSHFPPVATLMGKEGGSFQFADGQGERWMSHGETLPNGWSVVLLQPSETLSAQTQLFRNLSMTTAAIALLVTAIALSILSARLTRPILRLSHAATAISLGNLDQKIQIESSDEIGSLATAFSRVSEQLQQSFSQLAEQNESLKQLDRLKDQFLANTSHELKTPLNGMIGIAESLLEGAAGDMTESQRQNVAMIAASSHRLTRLVNDILDFSQLQNQQLALHCKPIKLCASVNLVLALSRTLVKNKSLTLTHDLSPELPYVYADSNRLQQILLNLISNAIKFTENGSVHVSAEVQHADDGQYASISVRDSGIGIESERLAHIFQPFQQEDAQSRYYGGTGLGLSITQHLVRLHQGKIWVESTLGKGTVVTFTLPIAEQAVIEKGKDAASSPAEPITAQTKSLSRAKGLHKYSSKSSHRSSYKRNPNQRPELVQLRSLRRRSTLSSTLANAFKKKNALSAAAFDSSKFNILVVDDEPINVQVLRNHLSLENYTVTHALNGKAALALLSSGQKSVQTFDLVVLDVMMPHMSGYEVCQKLRESHPAHELPVVMLTAKNQISDLMTGFHFGANDYMTKPFSKDELLTRIKSHLQLSKTNHSYGRFVPSEYLRFLKKDSIVEVKLGDHVSKEMAVMFSDIRSFTTLSESMTPQENFDFVNAYLRQVSPVIRDQNGFIVKYLGDGMMAVFPESVDDAVAAGIAKLRSVAEYNQRRQADGFCPIAVGIGIHFGHMMVGMVGEAARMQGDAFSDNVNLTARLESLTKLYGVSMIVSDRALSQLSHPERYQTRFLDRVIVKGRSEPISLYQVLNGEPESTIEQLELVQDSVTSGISYYQSGLFKKALACFQQALEKVPGNKTAQLYRIRLKQLISAPPKHWDGVWKLSHK
ncbi:MAG: ATP-binding protein [Cyanobacteria bacterium J06573_11]